MYSKVLALFGGEKAWSPGDWTASDDRVRGGNSQSFLECSTFNSIATFHGQLDIKTLGGAGFASQRTTGDSRSWDLSEYDGIRLDVFMADHKRYTFVIKDELLPKNPENGREQSTISYEYDFRYSTEAAQRDDLAVFIPWSALTATYRGKEKKDAPPLVTTSIKRFSLMMRSFFGDQEGPFSLSIRSISAVKLDDTQNAEHGSLGSMLSDISQRDVEKGELPWTPHANTQRNGGSSWLSEPISIRHLIVGFAVAALLLYQLWP